MIVWVSQSHSTEMGIFNDSGHCVVMVLLELTVVFDTADHHILLSSPEKWVTIQGSALEWFRPN